MVAITPRPNIRIFTLHLWGTIDLEVISTFENMEVISICQRR